MIEAAAKEWMSRPRELSPGMVLADLLEDLGHSRAGLFRSWMEAFCRARRICETIFDRSLPYPAEAVRRTEYCDCPKVCLYELARVSLDNAINLHPADREEVHRRRIARFLQLVGLFEAHIPPPRPLARRYGGPTRMLIRSAVDPVVYQSDLLYWNRIVRSGLSGVIARLRDATKLLTPASRSIW